MPTSSALTTLLFTDIVGSTEKAAGLGNRRWRELLQRHNALVRGALRRFGGREVSTAGDGFLVTFDRPAKAIRCACAIRDGVKDLGLEIRSGVHMGEVDLVGGNVGGLAVHTASRVQAQAGAGEVLVSSTVRELVDGLGFGFEDRGLRTLKGVPGEWRVFAVTSLPADVDEALERPWPLGLKWSWRTLATAATVLAVLLGALAVQRVIRDRGPHSGPVPTISGPAPGLAVLPFTVQGPDLELWREGMVTVLSTNLDGAAGLRAIDPRAVLSHWDVDIGEGKDAADRQAALQVARTLGSKYALMGSMVGSNDIVRLTAELYDVSSGAPLGTEQVEGKPDSLLALIDRLSIQVLRGGLVGSSGQVPRLKMRLTTSSLPALKAYLEGEHEFRRSHFGDAAAAFTRAIEADSTFAFAYYRLAEGCGWESVNCDLTTDYDSLAMRYADRLPERDRLLFDSELGRSPSQAIKALQRFTTLYPDDVEGWFELGDISYHPHAPEWSYVPQKDAMAAFRHAIELDPGFGPAYLHLLPDAFARDDTLEARRLLGGLRKTDSTSAWVIGQTLAYELTFGDSAGRARAVAALDTASTQVLRPALPTGMTACCATSPGHWEQDLQVARALTAPRHPLEDRQWAQYVIGHIYQSRGRLREAREAY
ncbi:MAG TPA: adenylate/guanylate cyclase domain-containing protein, partial [Dehalococcoidia bacterium]